jgi:hypothetical protein
VAFTWRIHEKHAIALRYLWNRRDTSFPDLGDRTQTRGTIGIYYTLLGHDRFGAVDWRLIVKDRRWRERGSIRPRRAARGVRRARKSAVR